MDSRHVVELVTKAIEGRGSRPGWGGDPRRRRLSAHPGSPSRGCRRAGVGHDQAAHPGRPAHPPGQGRATRANTTGVICVYTLDYQDLEELAWALELLRPLAPAEWLNYKTDADTVRGVYGCGVRAIGRRLGRSPSTISRELRRNAATRGGRLDYRATTAQWHADQRPASEARDAGRQRGLAQLRGRPARRRRRQPGSPGDRSAGLGSGGVLGGCAGRTRPDS